MVEEPERLKVSILPPVADLYNRLWPDIQKDVGGLVETVAAELQDEELDVVGGPVVSTGRQVEAACRRLRASDLDLVLVAMAPYCASGVLRGSLAKLEVPVLLWPMQSMLKLDPARYDAEMVKLNHGVHAVQDLANVLRKDNKVFGVIHGHFRQKGFADELKSWARAGRAVRAMKRCKPVQLGGHFQDMLDLQIADDAFLKRMGARPHGVSLGEFSTLMGTVPRREVDERLACLRDLFEIGEDVSEQLLAKTARGDAALRKLVSSAASHACGLNFLELCNDPRIADGLHVAASCLMSEGYGYAGEGDWVTAMLVHGLQRGAGTASFTEMFSVGYADNRLLLKHWGEGNFRMARARPRLLPSTFQDRHRAEFLIVDFEFAAGPAMLVNLNSTPQGIGQLICIAGTITEDRLPRVSGPRAVFKPEARDVRELLTSYATQGGSHHLALVGRRDAEMPARMARLAGWQYIGL